TEEGNPLKKRLIALLTALLVLSTLTVAFADHDKGNGKSQDHNKNRKGHEVVLGVDVLLDEQKQLIEGTRVGLITNPTGVDKDLNSIVDLLHNDPDVELTALYGPEHGVRGDAQAGQ